MKLYIEQGSNESAASKFVCGPDTYVYVISDDGTKTDISNMVRNADVRLHLGEAVTANLEVYVTGFNGYTLLDNLMLKEFKRRRWWNRKWRDVTTFASRTGARIFG